MLLNAAEGCCRVRHVFRYPLSCVHLSPACMCMVMTFSVFACASHVPLLCRQASGPSLNLIEFMDQQALYPTLSRRLVIELNYHFDTYRKKKKKKHKVPWVQWLLCRDITCNDLYAWTSARACSSCGQTAINSIDAAVEKSCYLHDVSHNCQSRSNEIFHFSRIQIFPINSRKCLGFYYFPIKWSGIAIAQRIVT